MPSQTNQLLSASYAATDAAFEIVLARTVQLAFTQDNENEIPPDIRDILNSDSWVFAETASTGFCATP